MQAASKRNVAIWLLSGCLLIFCMVVIGGVTRLTGSGLSITEWNLVMGTLPPLNDAQWEEAFRKYQEIPQFREVNSHFTLPDFKSIFWWEYIHRLLGRLLGFVFLIPFVWFVVTSQLDKSTLKRVLFLFFLGGLQGFLGWFMVKSGLTERTSVSHIRLAIHLITAFITFGFTLWFALELLFEKRQTSGNKTRKALSSITALLVLQIIYGAFVAGLHAGMMFNTFPLMNGSVFPAGGWALSPAWLNVMDNPGTVQFIHRTFAYLLVVLIGGLWWMTRRDAISGLQRIAVNVLLMAVLLQFLLGLATLLTGVNIVLASLHQIGAFLLFAGTVFALFQFRGSRVEAT